MIYDDETSDAIKATLEYGFDVVLSAKNGEKLSLSPPSSHASPDKRWYIATSRGNIICEDRDDAIRVLIATANDWARVGPI